MPAWSLRTSGELQRPEPEWVADIQAATGFSPATLQVCFLRGLRSAAEIQEFLKPSLARLKDPFSIKDMDQAVVRLVRARAERQRIRIFGDYDVDGTCSASLLTWFFRDLEFDFDAVQPDRFKDGYGLNVGAVEAAAQAGVRVLVTVDCGISSFEAARRAQELGVDLIIVDHHQIDSERGLPAAHAIVNPQRPDCESGLKQLCGCGLAFYLTMALRSRGRELGWFNDRPEPNLREHLDLVLLATAADMVPLVGDNRILVAHGMDVLKASRKPGIRALLEVSGIAQKQVSVGQLGFVLGPRINASGRLKSAAAAYELLTTKDPGVAGALAQELNVLNAQRTEIQNEIWDQVRLRVSGEIKEGLHRHSVVVWDRDWHEGVIGIVASRVTETFKKPAVVISVGESFGKGSARSYGGKNILEGLRSAKDSLRTFGGHAFAAGLSIEETELEGFRQCFDSAMEKIQADSQHTTLWLEGDLKLEEIDLKTLLEFERLGPFGIGNPEPVFRVRAQVNDKRVLKDRHLKLNLKSSHRTTPLTEAIWFHAMEDKGRVEALEDREQNWEWAVVPEVNRFMGRARPSLRIRDARVFEENL